MWCPNIKIVYATADISQHFAVERKIEYHIWPRNLNFPEKFALLLEFAKNRQLMPSGARGERFFGLRLDRYSSIRPGSFDEFFMALRQNPRCENFHFKSRFWNQDRTDGMEIEVGFDWQTLSVTIDATHDDTSLAAHQFLKDTLTLSNPPLPDPDEARMRNLMATIFLGKHFDTEAEQPARAVQKFLELLGFRVVQAEAYHAEPIPDKVKRLINEQDIYVGLVTGRREHDWLMAEAAYAHGKDKHIVMVVEDGSGFNPTLHGRDYEQIIFPAGTVEKSFIKMLEEFRSVGVSGLLRNF